MRTPSVLAVVLALAAPAHATPIPNDPFAAPVPTFVGAPATPRSVPAPAVPQHPFMAPNGRSNIHDDAYQTDTYVGLGPLGRNPEVLSTQQNAECGSLTFDSAGRIVTVCVGFEGPRLAMFDPATLDLLAVFPLPPRSAGGGGVFSDFSGGGYFYLDDQDRAVIPTNSHQIWVVGETTTAAGPAFELVRTYDLSTIVGPTEGIISCLPDWSGLLWFVTVHALVGTSDPASGAVQRMRLAGEAIGNSFAADETGGVFIVSDHAMYRFDAGAMREPVFFFRAEDGIRDRDVTGVQTCALPIFRGSLAPKRSTRPPDQRESRKRTRTNGRLAAPAAVAEYPCAWMRSSGRKKKAPPRAP